MDALAEQFGIGEEQGRVPAKEDEAGDQSRVGVACDVMRELRQSSDARAREAIDLFIYRIVREIGSLAAALGGLDALVFTGGIGQKDKLTRREVVAGCAWLGAAIDEDANGVGQGRIDSSASSLPIWVLPTDEERVIARHTAALLGKAPVSEAEPLRVEVPGPPVHG